MEIYLKIAGVLLILLSFIHIIFPRYFNWEKELKYLSLINQEMMKIHTFFIALTVFLMGVLCLTSAHELETTILGKRVALGILTFWSIRLYLQFFGYSKELWKGKAFETFAHIGFSLLWMYLCAVFFIVATT